MRNIIAAILIVPMYAYADLGTNYPLVTDSLAEYNAKQGANNLGITQIYDHPTQVSNGQFYVPIEYNRTGDPAAGEQDANSPANTTDIDYVPLSQLKGTNGVNGTNGVAGTNGSNGAQGPAGTVGATGAKGEMGRQGPQGIQGPKGDAADVPAIDPRLDVEIREYDARHWSLSSYASFGMQTSTVRYIVGQRLVLKLGDSSEQREIDKLRAFIGRFQHEQAALLGE